MQNPLSGDASFYKQLFERSHIVKLIIDPVTTQIVEANPAACTFYGYTHEQLTAMRLTDININTMSEHSIHDVIQRIINNQETILQTQHRLASGKVCDVEVFVCGVERDSNSYLYAIVTDITAQEQAKKALRESENIYRLFAQNMPDSSVLMFDTQMRYTLVEGPFLKRFGTIKDGMLGKTPQESLQPEVIDFVVALYQRALNGESFSYERSNADYAYESFVSPVRDESGNIIGGMVLSHDITQRHFAAMALQESEERLRLITDNIQDIVTLGDENRRVIYTNPSYTKILGYDIAPLIGQSPFEYVHPEDRVEMMRLLQVAQLTHQSETRMEFRWRHADGYYLDFDAIAKFLYDDQFNYRGGIVVARNITERKQLEEALRASEERLRFITDSIPDLITQGDVENRITYANPAARTILGMEPEALIGQSRVALVHPDDLQRLIGIYKKNIESGVERMISEGRLRHVDGHYVEIETIGSLLYDTQSNYMGAVTISRDITERKRLEEALRASEERLRFITDSAPDLITQSDADNRITYANPAVRTLLGIEPEAMLGKLRAEFIHPDDLQPLDKIYKEGVESGVERIRSEARLRHVDGHYVQIETIGRLLYNAQSDFAGAVYITRDITERKKLYNLQLEKERLQTALTKEEELSDLKTRMMARIAHEFRTPLTVIQASMETLMTYFDRLTPAERDERADTVRSQILRITDMLDAIGLIVKRTFIPKAIDRSPTDVSKICRDLAVHLAEYFKLPDKYVLHVPETTIVSADAKLIRTALLHIMRNAGRFSDPSAVVTVDLSRHENGIEIRVSDTGIGILPEELPRIFEPFFRGSNINERSGLGVGLTIAQGVIEAHGGSIEVESVLNKGTTVTIYIPIVA